LTGALIVVFLLYRPRGLIEERPVKTPLYEVLSGNVDKLRIGFVFKLRRRTGP
jgi:branched-chain amino acid transport system permease protein